MAVALPARGLVSAGACACGPAEAYVSSPHITAAAEINCLILFESETIWELS